MKKEGINNNEQHSRHGLWLLLLVIAGFLLRISNLEVTGFWMDELHSAFGVDPTKSVAEIIEYCKQDQPPVFFLTLHAWFKVFPFSDFYGRLFSVIIGCLSVVVMYFLGRELRSRDAGLTCAFITTINYLLIDQSRQMRFYPLVFLLSALSFLFFYRVIKRRTNVDFAGYIFATALLLNTHYFGIVIFVTQFILLIVVCVSEKMTDWKFITKAVVAGIITALSFAHWLPVVLSDVGISDFHIKPLTWWFPVKYWWVYFQDPIACVAFAVLVGTSFRIFFSEYKATGKIGITAIVLTGWITFAFLIPLVYSLVKIPMLEYKYTVIALPALFVLIAIGAETLSYKFRIAGASLLVASFLVIAMYVRPIYNREPFEQWREITALVEKTDAKDQFVFSNYAWYFRYYFKQFSIQNQPFEPQYADFKNLIDQSSRVYLLTQTRYPDPGLSAEQAEYLNEYFEKTGETKFVDAVATLYTRKK